MFKTKAGQLEKALKSAGFSFPISVNNATDLSESGGKPRKGSFVVKFGNSTKLELLSMPRPFTALRNTDIGKLVSSIMEE